MVQPVSVRCNILSCHRESNRILAGRHFFNPQQILAYPQNVAFLNCRRNSDTFVVDHTVAFGRVDRQDGFHLRQHLMLVHLQNIYRRIHEIYRLMRQRRCIRANMGCNQHIAF
ncbi:hypothetical protein D3C76_1337360 [compost metagenome]